jgi:pimeloyl-ACP methyl ester carboxylesterase
LNFDRQWKRPWWMAGICLAGACLVARADGAVVPTTMPASYGQPGQSVAIGHGRTLNLRCSGTGSRTVLLEAGSHADASSWFRLQPLLAPFVRVCAYDRAGYGFSPPGPLPRDLQADVADLHALIRHAGLATPLVLVGHSLGSNIARQYAGDYPADVAGMVLLDPPAQDVAALAPDWARDEKASNARRFVFIRQCEAGAENGKLPAAQGELSSCIAPASPLADADLFKAMNAYKTRPGFWRTLLSELEDNAAVFGQPVPPGENHGSTPLIVLTAADTYVDAPAGLRKKLEQARDATQRAIVATSTRGERWPVDDSSHDIQMDRPAVVARAVRKVLRETGEANQAAATAAH